MNDDGENVISTLKCKETGSNTAKYVLHVLIFISFSIFLFIINVMLKYNMAYERRRIVSKFNRFLRHGSVNLKSLLNFDWTNIEKSVNLTQFIEASWF